MGHWDGQAIRIGGTLGQAGNQYSRAIRTGGYTGTGGYTATGGFIEMCRRLGNEGPLRIWWANEN